MDPPGQAWTKRPENSAAERNQKERGIHSASTVLCCELCCLSTLPDLWTMKRNKFRAPKSNSHESVSDLFGTLRVRSFAFRSLPMRVLPSVGFYRLPWPSVGYVLVSERKAGGRLTEGLRSQISACKVSPSILRLKNAREWVGLGKIDSDFPSAVVRRARKRTPNEPPHPRSASRRGMEVRHRSPLPEGGGPG